MLQGLSLQVQSSSASSEIPRIFLNPKVYYHIQAPAVCPYPEPDQSSPSLHISLLEHVY